MSSGGGSNRRLDLGSVTLNVGSGKLKGVITGALSLVDISKTRVAGMVIEEVVSWQVWGSTNVPVISVSLGASWHLIVAVVTWKKCRTDTSGKDRTKGYGERGISSKVHWECMLMVDMRAREQDGML